MAGTFKTNESVMENVNGKIYVTLPINTYKGLEGYPVLTVDDKEYTFSVVGDELRAVIPEEHVSPNSLIEFALAFKSKGMEKLEFSPLGTDYIVNITSNYASPSFKGDFLPSTRNVTDEGFDAKWEVTALNTCNAYNSSFGVDFIVTADQYQQTERTMKYSFLFVILILSAIFLVESISRSKINVVQYIVTGLSLCLFYLLLLSISEYISFGWAYLIAATMTTGALGGYFYGFLKSKVAGGFTLATGILYAFIYMLLQMESGGLLCGSLALFVILCVIMYFTRRQGVFESRETIE
jgi:inner membrane protein